MGFVKDEDMWKYGWMERLNGLCKGMNGLCKGMNGLCKGF